MPNGLCEYVSYSPLGISYVPVKAHNLSIPNNSHDLLKKTTMLNIELSLKLLFWRSCPVNFFLYVKLLFPLYICLYLASFPIFVLPRWICRNLFPQCYK